MTAERKCYHCDRPTTNELVCDACRPNTVLVTEGVSIGTPPSGQTMRIVGEGSGEDPPLKPYMQMTRDYLDATKAWEASREEARKTDAEYQAAQSEAEEHIRGLSTEQVGELMAAPHEAEEQALTVADAKAMARVKVLEGSHDGVTWVELRRETRQGNEFLAQSWTNGVELYPHRRWREFDEPAE